MSRACDAAAASLELASPQLTLLEFPPAQGGDYKKSVIRDENFIQTELLDGWENILAEIKITLQINNLSE